MPDKRPTDPEGVALALKAHDAKLLHAVAALRAARLARETHMASWQSPGRRPDEWYLQRGDLSVAVWRAEQLVNAALEAWYDYRLLVQPMSSVEAAV